MPQEASTTALLDDLPPWAHSVSLDGGRRIRQARPEEFAAVEETLVTAFTTGCWVAPAYQAGLQTVRRRAETWHIWVVTDSSQEILGVVLTPRVRYWRAPDFSFSVLATAPAGRGLGLGGELVDHAVNLARAYGFERLLIHSSPQMSRAHQLYYAKGFVRRIDQETMFASEFDERLLTFTYRVPRPLPSHQVIRLEPASPDPAALVFNRRAEASDRAAWPLPAGRFDQTGWFWPDQGEASWRDSGAALASAGPAVTQRVLTELSLRGRLILPQQFSASQSARQILGDVWAGLVTTLHSPLDDAVALGRSIACARLDWLEASLASSGPFLCGAAPGPSDAALAAVLVRLDLALRGGLGFGAPAAPYWPGLWNLARRVIQTAGLTQELLVLTGLAARPDGGFNQPYGPLPEVFGLPDIRAAWLDRASGSRLVLPPPDRSVPATPWSGDLPPSPESALDLAAELTAASVTRQVARPTAQVAHFNDLIGTDLAGSVQRLAAGAGAQIQVALRRVLFARLAWFEARLSQSPYLLGPEISGPDWRLARFLELWRSGRLPGLLPIDPVLKDYPVLESFRERLASSSAAAV
ncbi:MAG: GNAT family N-acetyltransferase [Bifidobacteriaceae bacterium]|jgi:putative glutathione S-transferase|nr:GNAT family N-acetyltransferase [Bifidobacteriaceae bacterium]